MKMRLDNNRTCLFFLGDFSPSSLVCESSCKKFMFIFLGEFGFVKRSDLGEAGVKPAAAKVEDGTELRFVGE